MSLLEDLWTPLYDRVNYPGTIDTIEFDDKLIDQIYRRACRRYPGDACQYDNTFYHGGLFDLVNGYDKFGLKKE